jgi:subtilisin-like proprotein convertase family protein
VNSLANADPSAEQVSATSSLSIPESFVAHGPLHRVIVRQGDPAFDQVMTRGAVVASEDYGSFWLLLVDARRLITGANAAAPGAVPAIEAGVAAIRDLGLDIVDEGTLVDFNGYLLDGADPAGTRQRLGAIPAELDGDAGSAAGDDRRLRVVQFIGPIKDAWLDALRATGAHVVTYAANNAYVVRAGPAANAALDLLAAEPYVLSLTGYRPAFKLRPELRPPFIHDSAPYKVIVQVIRDEDGEAFAASLGARSLAVLAEPDAVLDYLNVELLMDGANILELARDSHVFAIEEKLAAEKLDERQGQIMAGNLDVTGTQPNGPNYFTWLASKGFPGVDPFPFVVDVTDDGIDRGSLTDVNVEFKVDGLAGGASRLAYINNYSGDALGDSRAGHGNINASIICGYNSATGTAAEDSAGYNYGLGLAPWVKVGDSKVFNNAGSGVFNQATSVRMANAYNAGARISSNSWGYTSGTTYNTDSQAHDVSVRDAVSGTAGNQELTIVFAAGNSGPGASTVHPPGTAKNVITVGATENWRMTGTDGCAVANSGADSALDIINFSSRGPTSDSRKKPEICAPGTHIEGAASRATGYNGSGVCNQYWPAGQTLYAWSSGTSHSTPGISGACALVRQWFANSALGTPSPALLKAWLVSSSTYMTGLYANDTLWSNNQGMGRVNLGTAFDGAQRVTVDETQVLGATGATYSVSGNISSSALPFRVSLAWTDAPGATTGNAYVNNLDLEVTVNGTLYRGNVFSGANSVAGGTADVRNNLESVFLPAGTAGSYTVTVRATNIAGDGVPGNADTSDQDFALVVYNGSSGAPAPDFTLASSPSSSTVTAGNSAAFTVSNSGTNGFANNVSLSAAPAIGGVTFSFSPNPEAANGSSTFTCTTTSGATTGTQTITITGTDGTLTHTTNVSLTINPAPVPDFTLAASPSTRTVTAGGSTTYAVSNTAVNGFSGNVSLSASPAISGVAYSFSPNPEAAGGSSTLTCTTTAGAATGTHTITITGTSGSLTHTATVSLTISAVPVADFTLSATPPSSTVTAGGSAAFSVSNAALNGFSGSITLSATPAISGVSYSFSPNPMAAGGSSTLTCTTTAGAATGTQAITITGTSGSLTHTTGVSLTINPASGGNPVKTYSIAPNTAIPDNNATGITSTINVPDSSTVASVSVGVNITHSYKGDLVVTLIGPDNTSAILHNRSGGSADNVITTFAVATAPNQALSVFNGKNTSGGWKLKVQDLAAADLGTLVSWTVTFNGEQAQSPNLAIPDNNATGVTSTMTVSQTGTVASVKLKVGITHTYQGDLQVTLIAPDGTSVILHNRTGGGTDNINTEYPDLTVPNQSLSAFTGKSINGAWKLKVADLAAVDTGTLNSWTLSLAAQ